MCHPFILQPPRVMAPMSAYCALVSMVVFACPALGQNSLPGGLPQQIAPEALLADGFQSLIQGQSLDGWRVVNGNGQFRVDGEAIIGFGENVKQNTFLRTEEEFGDFICAFEFQFRDRAGNSGLMFRAQQRAGEDGRVFGYQCEHDQNHGRSWSAGLYDEARRGWLVPANNDAAAKQAFTEQGQRLFRWDDWNQIVIRCQGKRVQIWLNGELRVDYLESDSALETARGFIALQVHSGAKCHVAWRRMYLKSLPPAEPKGD